MKEELKIEQSWNGGESVLYRMRVLEVLNWLIEICSREDNMPLQTEEKKGCLI